MKWFGRAASLVVLLCLCAGASVAQETPSTGDALNLFFDCQGSGCRDMDFFRREVPVVNWVRDREVSDLHVLVTSQRTGGGGFMYTLAFIGRGEFEGEDQELEVSTAGDATSDEQRRAIVGRLKLGLVRYVQNTSLADVLTVTFADGAQEGAPGRPGGGTAWRSRHLGCFTRGRSVGLLGLQYQWKRVRERAVYFEVLELLRQRECQPNHRRLEDLIGW